MKTFITEDLAEVKVGDEVWVVTTSGVNPSRICRSYGILRVNKAHDYTNAKNKGFKWFKSAVAAENYMSDHSQILSIADMAELKLTDRQKIRLRNLVKSKLKH